MESVSSPPAGKREKITDFWYFVLIKRPATPAYITVETPAALTSNSPKDLDMEDFPQNDSPQNDFPEVDLPLIALPLIDLSKIDFPQTDFSQPEQNYVSMEEKIARHMYRQTDLDELANHGRDLLSFPYRLWSLVLVYLDFNDVTALALSCKRLYALLRSEEICKFVLEVCSPR